jgi:hypothetical protein
VIDIIGELVRAVLELVGAWPRKGGTLDELATAARIEREGEQTDLPLG